jgi:arylsulfatase G
LEGVHCGHDTGLGSLWEANLRMPALARWPGMIKPATESLALVSSLDLVPTVLSIVGGDRVKKDWDGMDISPVLFGSDSDFDSDDRVLFFWRDGFQDGPLQPPFGRFDVAAVKIGRFKAWIWTKSAHYNDDPEMFHNPPLLFDVLIDPAEAFPLNPKDYEGLIARIPDLVREHKESVDWTFPLTLLRGPKYFPCVDRSSGCRTKFGDLLGESIVS